MKHIKSYSKLHEQQIVPSTEKGTMSLWHGGNLDAEVSFKKGRYEYGPGLYLTTSYETVIKYAKGSRKMYMVTVEEGTDIKDVYLEIADINEFVQSYVISSKRSSVLGRLERFIKEDKVNADVFNNVLVNIDGVKPSNAQAWRDFMVDNGIDYQIVSNAFGWNETMLVIYNMDKIKGTVRVAPNDEIVIYDLPTKFN